MINRRAFFNCVAGGVFAHALRVGGQQSSPKAIRPVDTLPGAEKNRKLKVVFVGAHVDDWIFCVGTLARYAREGHDVLCFSFTPGDSQSIADAHHMPLDKLAAIRTEDGIKGTKLFGARLTNFGSAQPKDACRCRDLHRVRQDLSRREAGRRVRYVAPAVSS